VNQTLTAGSQELRLPSGPFLKASDQTADRRVRVVVFPSSTGLTLSEMRERVQKADTDARAATAREFAERVSATPFVKEVWLDDSGRTAVVRVIVEGATLDNELELEAVFTAMLAGRPRFDGYLNIHALKERDPTEARYGSRLFPE